MSVIEWTRSAPRRVLLLGLVLTAGSGAGAGALGGGPPAAAETGGAPTGPGAPSCPSPNPPNQLLLVAGTPQTTVLQTAFATNLQVALTNSDGCAVTTGAAGVPVTFSAPSSGASGLFSGSGSSTVVVGGDSAGAVVAPAFTANDTAGSYTLTASSTYGTVSFSLTNTAAGIPSRIIVIGPSSRSASVAGPYPQPLQVRVLDADGNPVAAATVTFTLGSGSASACGSGSSASASFIGAATQASETTGASGVASSALFAANSAAGSFTATAAVSGPTGAGAGSATGAAASSGTATAVSFVLRNLPGDPLKLATGVGSTQSTPAATNFPIRLAVTVTDAEKNPVPGALVRFAAPARGASGRFTIHSRGSRPHRHQVSHSHTVNVEADACGVALAPAFTADDQQGGYIVKATAKHARAAAFALTNEASG